MHIRPRSPRVFLNFLGTICLRFLSSHTSGPHPHVCYLDVPIIRFLNARLAVPAEKKRGKGLATQHQGISSAQEQTHSWIIIGAFPEVLRLEAISRRFSGQVGICN